MLCRFADRRQAWLVLAGPTALLTIILSWAVLLTVGWTLIYWPHLPDKFSFAPGLNPSNQDGFVDAFYLSLMTLTTLGYGDIAPSADWLRVVGMLEALVGFGLLTASITWILSLYPVFARRRSLAQEISLIGESEHVSGSILKAMNANAAERMLKDLTSGLVTVQGDFIRFPITYYFHNRDERVSLAAVMLYLHDLAERSASADLQPEVRRRAEILRSAIDHFSGMLVPRFFDLSSAPTEKVLEAYARDHLQLPRQGGGASGES